jgi:hypothetical protein
MRCLGKGNKSSKLLKRGISNRDRNRIIRIHVAQKQSVSIPMLLCIVVMLS